MADIFLSYARADRDRVAPLADALERLGWSVWWDPHIRPGRTFDDVIEEEIEVARAVICVWTPDGVLSRWVRTEAAEGLARGVLVPVVMGDVRIPLAFRRIQAADLSDWQPGTAHDGFDELVVALREVLQAGGASRPAARTVESGGVDASVIARASVLNAEGAWDATVRLLSDFSERSPVHSQDPEVVALLDEAQRGCEANELYVAARADAAAGDWRRATERLDLLAGLEPDHAGAIELRRYVEASVEQRRRNTSPSPDDLAVASRTGTPPSPAPTRRRGMSRWWFVVVLVVGLAGAVVGGAILTTGGGDDDPAPPPEPTAPAEMGIGENWFGERAEVAVPALRERGFTVIDYPVCSGSVGAGEVRQIIDSADGTIYLDREGITAAGERVPVETTIEVKVGTGTPC